MIKRKNPFYTDFLTDVIEYRYEILEKDDFSNVKEIKGYGTDKDSFREAYIKASQNSFTTIFHLDNPKVLRIGFIESVEKGFKEDRGWYQVWHTVRIQAWRTGSKSDPSYRFDFRQSLRDDVEALERKERKALDAYTPLFVSSLNAESYAYLGEGVTLFMPEYNKIRKEWSAEDDDRTFYEFLEEIKDERKT